MELRQLRYFLKAKELLNFTEAANSLYISQSTLSQQIRQLEDELGLPLFDRVGKKVALTQAGEVFAEYAFHSLQKAKDGYLALKDLNEMLGGSLQIGVTYGLRSTFTPALVAFVRKYPQVKVNVVFATSAELLEKLNKFELDFVLSFSEDTDAKHLKYMELYSSQLVLVTSPNSELAKRTHITLEEVAALPLALPEQGYSTTHFVLKAFRQSHLQPNISVVINDIPTLLELVRSGDWNTILTQATIADDGTLSGVRIDGADMTRHAMIVSLKEMYEKRASAEFFKLLLKR